MSFNTRNLIKIPEKIVVGFQPRPDTFTGKLAYVTHRDETGKLRKEASWEGWRSKGIPSLEVDNKPMSGFVINKGVQRCGDFGSGRSTIRIYHPLDFEFEIDVDNLTFLLMHSDVSKRDILQKCILAWQGASLVLLPVNCEEYETASEGEKTMASSTPMTKKNSSPGQVVLDKKRLEYVYIGEYDWWGFDFKPQAGRQSINQTNMGKKHIFFDVAQNLFVSKDIKNLFIKEALSAQFNDVLQKFTQCVHYQKIENIEMIPITEQDDPLCLKKEPYMRWSEGIYPIYFDNDEIDVCHFLVNHHEGAAYENGSPLSMGRFFRVKYKSAVNKFVIDSTYYDRSYNTKDNLVKGSKSLPKENLEDYFKRLYKNQAIGQAVLVMKDGTKIPVKNLQSRYIVNSKVLTIS